MIEWGPLGSSLTMKFFLNKITQQRIPMASLGCNIFNKITIYLN